MSSNEWWWWGSSGGGPPDPIQLLNEAAVRFDFSQYADINNMVDVNGGWGPLNSSSVSADSVAFTAQGLRLQDASAVVTRVKIEGVDGPLVMGSGSLTMMSVVNNGGPFTVTGGALSLIGYDLGGDVLGDYAPNPVLRWQVINDDFADPYNVVVYDLPPSYAEVARQDQNNVPLNIHSAETIGTFVAVMVVDVPNQEMRFSLVYPDGRLDGTVPFAIVPAFQNVETVLDGIYLDGANSTDSTYIEWVGWNSALSDADIDALVAHFQA